MINKNEPSFTLERAKFSQNCTILKWVSRLFFIFNLCIPVLYLLLVITGNNPSGMFSNNVGIITAVSDGVNAVGSAIAFAIGAKIFSHLAVSDSPFEKSIVVNIRKAGNILFVCGVLSYIILFIRNAHYYTAEINEFIQLTNPNTTLFIGAVLIILAYIFGHGCKLQQESDETV